MQENNYEKAYTEVYEIIEHFSEDLKTKIPGKLMEFIKENRNENYVFEFDENCSIDNQNLLEETKAILTVIYRDFLCSEEEKEELNQILFENEKIFQKGLETKYSVKNLFTNKENDTRSEPTIEENFQQFALVKYKESIFERILRKISSIFSIKNHK